MNAIIRRKSIRKYTNKEIENEIINKILCAGFNAPCARGIYSNEYIVIKNKNTMKELSTLKKSASFLSNANAIIIVLGKEENEFFEHNAAASIENMLIEATSNDVASCWIGIYPNKEYEEKFRLLIDFPKELKPIAMISLGYSDEEFNIKNKYDEQKVHYEKW